MLKFHSLEILGFKSFAERIRVVFDDQVSTIVGPNGCGKSNLSDALGWVLGVQTAQGLRGQKMEDVIFSGTDRRKPSGMAKVTLRITREGDAPLILNGEALSDEELEISRQLFRSGESAYLINGRRCRLKDIHRFMEDSGLGFASYALIAQGKIDSFLSARPMDRRFIIEEAAQISSYRSKRRSTEVKLELAQQNLLRICDIVLEVERQLRSLKRQAAKAKRYREVKEEYDQLLRARFALEARSLGASREGLSRESEGLRTALEDVESRLRSSQLEYQRSTAQREEREGLVNRLTQARSETELELERYRSSLQYGQEQIQSTRRLLESGAEEKLSLERSLESIEGDRKRFIEQREELERERDRIGTLLAEASQRVERIGAELSAAEAELEQSRQSQMALSSRIASLRSQGEELSARLKAGGAAVALLEQEGEQSRSRKAEAERNWANAQERTQRQEAGLQSLRGQLEEDRRLQEELGRHLADLKPEREEVKGKLIAARERLQSLLEVERSRSQYSQSVQKLLHHLNREGGIQAAGTLADHVETGPEFERLVEEFLDEELEYVLVDSLDEAVRGVTEVKNLKTGRCTFMSLKTSNGFGQIPRNTLNGLSNRPGVFGALGDLLEMKPDVKEAFLRVLPTRADAVVVADLDLAFDLAHEHPQMTFITLEGESLTPSGLLTASSAQSGTLGLLGLKRQKRELEKRLHDSQRALAALDEKVEMAGSALEERSLAVTRSQEVLHQSEKELVGLGHQAEQCKQEVARRRAAVTEFERRLAEQQAERQQVLERSSKLEAVLAENEESRSQTEAGLEGLRDRLNALKSDAEKAQTRLHDVDSDHKVLEERSLSLRRALERIEEQRQGIADRLASGLRRQEEAESRLKALEASCQRGLEDLKECEQRLQDLRARLSSAEGRYREWKEQHPAIERRLNDLRERSARLREERSHLEVEAARIDTQLHSIAAQCEDLLQSPLQEIAATTDVDHLSLEAVVGTCRDRKNRLEGFGPINMTALQEYQENEERHEFLSKQRQDIEQSIADTTKAIQDLNRRSREQFQKAFAAVNRFFSEYFAKLFGGGECGMRLLDEEDLLESGLDVYAQPPGKKLQHVSLLSGGEKALTGLALLLSLFSYRPSRFCILDEVDAPLDEANVARFARLIEEMSSRTQFILITHNKKTMEISKAIYGVTMEEAGVSSVVSVRI